MSSKLSPREPSRKSENKNKMLDLEIFRTEAQITDAEEKSNENLSL